MELKEIQYRDKTKNKLTIYKGGENSKISVICLPAMGVRASFYKKFATQLSAQGFNLITADWRGHGNSSLRASRKINFGYEEMIGDIHELIDHVNKWFPDSKILILGHSLGGQIGSLYASRYSESIRGLILITACSVYYKGWENWTAKKIQVAARFFYPLSKIMGYFPGNVIGFGGKEARHVMKDWGNNALTGKYKLTNSEFDYENSLKDLIIPLVTISIENDELASKKAVENLYKKFNPVSTIKHFHLTSDQTGVVSLNHFNWAKKPEYFIDVIKDWVLETRV